jgi:hypothetical protein
MLPNRDQETGAAMNWASYLLGVATVPALALVCYLAAVASRWCTQHTSISCAVCPGRPRFGSDVHLGQPLYVWQWIRWQRHAASKQHRTHRLQRQLDRAARDPRFQA